MTKKIGLLLPRSVMYPSISFDILNGVRASTDEAGEKDIEIKTESIGTGGDDKLIYACAERLLMDGAGIVAGYINPTTAAKLQPLFAAGGAILIALDAGYHYPLAKEKPTHVFSISLEGALCCRIAAKMAARDGYSRFAYTSSFYDAGYRSAMAFANSIEDAGGSITYNHITKLKRAEYTLEPLAGHLLQPDANAVIASFCGDMMQDFCTAASQGGMFGSHPVYGSPFMADEQWLAQSIYPGVDIKTAVTWASGLQHQGNKNFIEKLNARKQKANLFSVLGWEAGTLISAMLKANDTDSAIAKLENISYNSPRGHVSMDKDAHRTQAPVYEVTVTKDEATGKCALMPGAEYDNIDEERAKLAKEILLFDGQATSWYNVYGCIES